MINPVDRLSWQEMLGHPASAGHLVDTQVNTAYSKMAVLSDHIDEFKDLYDFIFRIKGWLKYYLQANYGLEDFSDIGLNNDTNGHSGSIDLIDPATGEVKTKKVWRIYIKNYDEIIKASEAGLPIPDPIVRFANIYDPLNPVYLDLEYKNGKPTFSGTFNPDDPNSYIPLWYLTGYTHTGNTVTLTGDTSGTGTVDADGNVVVPTAVSHAASADKTTGGTVNITGYVSGSGSFDSNGNVIVDVVPNIPDTPYIYYVGKTNARDYWGKDENGNQWGSTKDHPFASLGYAINQTNRHTFPGNSVQVWISESGEYRDFSRKWAIYGLPVTTETHVLQLDGVQAEIRTAYDISISSAASLHFHGITFRRCHIDSKSEAPDGVTFFRIGGGGHVVFYSGCRMITDSNNDDYNNWPFVESDVTLRFVSSKGKPGLTLELAGTGTVQYASFIALGNNGSFGAFSANADCPFLKIIAPNGTQARSCVFNTGRFCVAESYSTPYPGYRQYVDWDIADESKLVQVVLGGYAYFGLRKNPGKGQALPGHEVGIVPAGAAYWQADY